MRVIFLLITLLWTTVVWCYPTVDLGPRSPQSQSSGLGSVVSGLVGGLGSILSGLGAGLGATLDGTLGPLFGKGPNDGKLGPLGGAVEGLVGGLGGIVTGLGNGLGSTLNNTLNPLLGNQSSKPSSIPPPKDIPPPPQESQISSSSSSSSSSSGPDDDRKFVTRDPQGGLGGALGGLVGGLGNTVGSLGKGLGDTVNGALGSLAGNQQPKAGQRSSSRDPIAGQPRGTPRPVTQSSPPRYVTVTTVTARSPTSVPIGNGNGNINQPRTTSRITVTAPRATTTVTMAPQPRNTQPAYPMQPAYPEQPAQPRGKRASMMVTTNGGETFCRKYPDTISLDTSRLTRLSSPTQLEIQCWTNPSLPGNSGRVKGEAIWLQTRNGCYVNKREVREQQDFQGVLNQCEPPTHWVGIMQSGYTREDCYDCPSLNCPSNNIGEPPYVDLACTTPGEDVRGSKSQDYGCYFPAAVFNPNGWLGQFSVQKESEKLTQNRNTWP